MKKIVALLLTICAIQQAGAQQIIPCMTDEAYAARVAKHPELLVIEQDANRKARSAQMHSLMFHKKAPVRYIPVVFHIMYDVDNGFENILQSQIMDQIRIINEDYRKKAGTPGGTSTNPLATDMEIEFRLAQYDPNGQKHDGINRVQTAMTNNADDNIKALSYWDSDRYLNVWVVKSIASSSPGTVLGRAVFPTERATQPTLDGILIRYDYLGTIGQGKVTNGGRTLTHEAGHWMGLYHPFQRDIGQTQGDGCGLTTINSSNCGSTGDEVCDTPPVADATSGCPTTRNSCTNDAPDLNDLVKNYMDYADGSCTNMFTIGQRARIESMSFTAPAASTNRVNIVSTQNINAAGIDASGNYLPVAASSRKAPYNYSFEGNAIADGWKLNNLNNPGNGWQQNSSVGYTGTGSFYIRNFNNGSARLNSRDGFQSPEVDLTSVNSPWLTFYYAYSKKTAFTNDTFAITISPDFGMSEYHLWRAGGDSLATVAVLASEFIPTNQGHWRKVMVNLASFRSFTNARVRFELLNRRGNNMFIDEISIGEGPQGIGEEDRNFSGLSVMPNPVADKAELSFICSVATYARISLVDLLGRERMVICDQLFSAGDHTLTFSSSSLSKGIYMVRVQTGHGSFSQKIFVN